MKTILLEQNFINGFNAVAYRVQFADKVNFSINIGEPSILYPPPLYPPIRFPFNIGYLMIIDERQLQLIRLFYMGLNEGEFATNLYYGEESLFNSFTQMDITLSSNELIFIYVQNCKTTYDVINPYTNEIVFTLDPYPITSIHLNLFGNCKVKKLFQIIDDNLTKYDIKPLKKISKIGLNFFNEFLNEGDDGGDDGVVTPTTLNNAQPEISNISSLLQHFPFVATPRFKPMANVTSVYSQNPYPSSNEFPFINAIVYLIKLLGKLHISIPLFLLKHLINNFDSSTVQDSGGDGDGGD